MHWVKLGKGITKITEKEPGFYMLITVGRRIYYDDYGM